MVSTNDTFQHYIIAVNSIIAYLKSIRNAIKPRITKRKIEYEDSEELYKIGKFLTVIFFIFYFLFLILL